MKHTPVRRVLSWLLILSLLLSGCGAKEPESVQTQPSVTEEKQILLEHLTRYLDAEEAILGHARWALDYAQAYARDNSWESLQKARAAAAAAKQAVEYVSLPEYTLTKAQSDALTAAGVEVDALHSEYLGQAMSRTQKATMLGTLEAMLQQDVFLTASVSMFGPWIETNRNLLGDTCEYLCLMTNYLLLQLEDTGLWEQLPRKYPLIAEGQSQWSDDPGGLMESSTEVLDRYESRFVEVEEYLGVADYTLLLVQEAVQTGELENLSRMIHQTDGVPAYIPLPYWMPESPRYSYVVTDPRTGDVKLVESGQALEEKIAACYIPCPGISREDAESYGQQLTAAGLEPYVQWNEETQTLQLFTVTGESQMLVKWTQAETVIYLTEPIACLIPELYLAAMQAQ